MQRMMNAKALGRNPGHLGYSQKQPPRQGSMYGFYDTGSQSYQEFQMGEKENC